MVCIKYLFVNNRSGIVRFIEWVQLLRILGVDKIPLYNRHVHPEFFKILLYFQEKDYIELFDFLEPSELKTNKGTQKVRSLEGRIQMILASLFACTVHIALWANFFKFTLLSCSLKTSKLRERTMSNSSFLITAWPYLGSPKTHA